MRYRYRNEVAGNESCDRCQTIVAQSEREEIKQRALRGLRVRVQEGRRPGRSGGQDIRRSKSEHNCREPLRSRLVSTSRIHEKRWTRPAVVACCRVVLRSRRRCDVWISVGRVVERGERSGAKPSSGDVWDGGHVGGLDLPNWAHWRWP